MRSHRIALLLLLMTATPVAAQVSEARPGARVRITAPGVVDHRLTAIVLSRTGDTLTIGAPDVPSLAIPTSRITALDISRGDSRAAGALRGIEWGAPIGLALGLASANAAQNCLDCWADTQRPSRAEWVLSATVDGAAVGAIVGALVGRERWESLDVPQHTSFNVRNGRAALSVALAF